jgi:hypothetical protein
LLERYGRISIRSDNGFDLRASACDNILYVLHRNFIEDGRSRIAALVYEDFEELVRSLDTAGVLASLRELFGCD